MLSVTEWNRVTRFAEKPAQPEPMPGRSDVALASMGIYVFNAQLLEKLLTEDAADEHSSHDFGKNVIPKAIESLEVFAYPFRNVRTRAQNYWRDVGTVDAFYEANLELVHVSPELNVYDEEWPIWTYQVQNPPAKFVLEDAGRVGMAVNSLVSGGSHHLRRRGARVAAVLVGARRRAFADRALGDHARRAHRPRLHGAQRDHRRALRHSRRHADRRRSRTRSRAL